LEKNYKDILFPSFPPKFVFGNLKKETVSNRRKKLEIYLKKLLKIEAIQVLFYFFNSI
jgi:hypothetical protein